MLPADKENKTKLVIRRRHLYEDAFHKFRMGIDLNKNLSITFVGEAAVDIANDSRLLCGNEDARVPTHNVVELEKESLLLLCASFMVAQGLSFLLLQ